MELSTRVELMNWLVGQGLTGLPEPELLRGFSERCRAGGLDLSRALAFIDTLHPIYEGRGFRWTDRPSNEGERSNTNHRPRVMRTRTGGAPPFTT
jgi:adenylate cyclase